MPPKSEVAARRYAGGSIQGHLHQLLSSSPKRFGIFPEFGIFFPRSSGPATSLHWSVHDFIEGCRALAWGLPGHDASPAYVASPAEGAPQKQPRLTARDNAALHRNDVCIPYSTAIPGTYSPYPQIRAPEMCVECNVPPPRCGPVARPLVWDHPPLCTVRLFYPSTCGLLSMAACRAPRVAAVTLPSSSPCLAHISSTTMLANSRRISRLTVKYLNAR